ncbi:uncharacterized protein LOC125145714 [Tachysurus fulvidraco]|uniref:uncharacterized protein LOC125145714 n=1 Tax=Tachysurus fulvidraco TaxID=1234273 RepID=UPI001FF04B87|nr:uncharacterized protein LOC125145714 [Tachysurus fulvidraco]
MLPLPSPLSDIQHARCHIVRQGRVAQQQALLRLHRKPAQGDASSPSSPEQGIMNYFSICMILGTVCLSLISAADIPVSGHVGSTAVLPCELQSVDTETQYIRWLIGTETVFERQGKDTYEGEGYKNRVDVPEEELSKGNCSLVFKHLKLTDTADYMSYKVVKGNRGSNRFKRSETPELNLISKVHLSVIEKLEEKSYEQQLSGGASGMKCLHPQFMVLFLLSVSLSFLHEET